MTQLTPHMSDEELSCKCGCGFGSIADDYAHGFLDFLETLRMIYGRAIHPTSGARCHDHNAAVGGVNLSAHTRAAAADLSASNGFDRHGMVVAYVLARAVTEGWIELPMAISIAEDISGSVGGVGIAKTFIHVDNDIHLPRPSAWGYKPNTTNT